MKLTPDTIKVLTNFAGISQSLLFTTDKVISTIAESKNILAQAQITEEFPQEFGIYDLNEFLATVELFGDPSLEFDTKSVKIKEDAADKKSSCKYFFADSSMIPAVPDTTKILAAIKSAEIKFQLTEGNLNNIMKAAGTLKSPHIVVESDGKKIWVKTSDVKNDTSNSFLLEVGKGIGKNFKMVYKQEYLKMMKGGYEVKISSKKISQFKNDALDLNYWIALEDSSIFG